MMNELKGKVAFNDVAGVRKQKKKLKKLWNFKRSKKFSRLGGKSQEDVC